MNMGLFDKKILATASAIILIAVVVSGFAFANWGPQAAEFLGFSVTGDNQDQDQTVNQYTQGLTAHFKINDAVDGALVTSNVAPTFYNSGANPLSATSSDVSVTSAAYSSPNWQATLNAGSYSLLITDTNENKYYPLLQTVSVPSTNTVNQLTGDVSVMLTPAVLQLTQRATPTMTATIKAYDSDTHLYSIATSTLDFSTNGTYTSTKQDVKIAIDVGGSIGQKIAAGRIYLPVITGISYSGVTINGVATTLASDLVGTADGVSGQYVTFSDIPAGTTLNLDFKVNKVGAGPADSSAVVITLYEAYSVQNTDLRWWSDSTSSLAVTIDD
jgi:hypothetical protein